jgi:hypothetical protein
LNRPKLFAYKPSKDWKSRRRRERTSAVRKNRQGVDQGLTGHKGTDPDIISPLLSGTDGQTIDGTISIFTPAS